MATFAPPAGQFGQQFPHASDACTHLVIERGFNAFQGGLQCTAPHLRTIVQIA